MTDKMLATLDQTIREINEFKNRVKKEALETEVRRLELQNIILKRWIVGLVVLVSLNIILDGVSLYLLLPIIR